MDVNIEEIISTVRAIDSDSLVSSRAMASIVRSVLQAVDERDEHRKRVRAERRITAGVAHEQAEEE
jgi:hypothetical protein